VSRVKRLDHYIKRMLKRKAVYLLLLLAVPMKASVSELRGTWLAWAGTAVPSSDQIAVIMDSLAAAHFNTVYVDVWRFGYPYFRSEIFHNETGLLTDPNIETSLQPQRDVLAEMIAEAHRVGLEVHAWFEAGFNGASSTSSPLYQSRTRWFASKQDGSLASYGQAGPSMIHVSESVQSFLLKMTLELIRKYDIDGVEMDRIRYPSLDCGYDALTKNLYREEHEGQDPPSNTADPEWVRWRADKLSEFVALMYDSVKAVDPDIMVSNAPLPWGYEQFAQDYAPWINDGTLDHVTPQMYTSSSSDFIWRLETEMAKVDNDALIYPGISTVANSAVTPASELISMIENIRSRGMHGHVIWYHANLLWDAQNDYLKALKNSVYSEAAVPHFRRGYRREPAQMLNELANTVRTSGWNSYSGAIPLYEGACLYAVSGSPDSIRYSADIPVEGWYELYAFVNTQTNAATAAHYRIRSTAGVEDVFVNQKLRGNAGRWHKFPDLYLAAGDSVEILSLHAATSNGSYVFADAVMLKPSLRKTRIQTPLSLEFGAASAEEFELSSYPNPFNHSLSISFNALQRGHYRLEIRDIRGRTMLAKAVETAGPGPISMTLDAEFLPSGVYLLSLSSASSVLAARKITLLK